MRSINKRVLKGGLLLPIVVVALSGCATAGSARVIKPGDRVGVRFTCRLPDGEIAASTDKSVADDGSLRKSAVFIPSSNNDPVGLPAGSDLDELRNRAIRPMEEEIISQLVDRVDGMRSGEIRAMKLTAKSAPATKGDSHILQMARVRHRPKELRISLDDYKSRKHEDPVVGQEYTVDPAFPGRVTGVKDGEVVVGFSARAGDVVKTPFGSGVIRELKDRYEYDIDARKGSLVRTGPMVGCISSVDDRYITIDYSNPFGGEELDCDVRPEIMAGAEAVKEKTSSAGIDPAGNPDAARKGDLVTVNFTASLEDGAVFGTTLKSVSEDEKRKKAAWFEPRQQYAPEEVKAGSEELLPGLGEAVTGMSAGERKRVALPPEKAFGPRDETKTAQYPLKHKVPATITLSADEYVNRFGGFPAAGKEVQLDPYLKAKVEKIGEKDVTLTASGTDGARFSEPYGTITETVAEDGVTMTLDPKLGATFHAGERVGEITAADGETFTVDFNPPLAGKTIILDLQAVKVTRADPGVKPVEWIEDRDAGLAEAKKEGKPVFLLLYADWCGWCKKTMTETIPDQRISGLKDRFVWVKVNSDKEKKYKEEYGQNGYPMIVLLKPDGTVLKKIDGFRDARGLKAELEGVI